MRPLIRCAVGMLAGNEADDRLTSPRSGRYPVDAKSRSIARSCQDFCRSTTTKAFQPSVYRSEPFAAVATIALAADTAEEADRLAALAPRPPERPGAPPENEGFIRRFRGEAAAVRAYLAEKAAHTGANELFVLNGAPTLASRLRSMELIAERMMA